MFNTCQKFMKYISLYNIKNNNNIMLGRWILKNDCVKKETISVFWANSDHCGDHICGNPIKNKIFLDEKMNNLKK